MTRLMNPVIVTRFSYLSHHWMAIRGMMWASMVLAALAVWILIVESVRPTLPMNQLVSIIMAGIGIGAAIFVRRWERSVWRTIATIAPDLPPGFPFEGPVRFHLRRDGILG